MVPLGEGEFRVSCGDDFYHAKCWMKKLNAINTHPNDCARLAMENRSVIKWCDVVKPPKSDETM
jgi:hypothetical protein